MSIALLSGFRAMPINYHLTVVLPSLQGSACKFCNNKHMIKS